MSVEEVSTGLSFGEAIDALKDGEHVARRGWNGNGMWLALVPGGVSELPDGSEFDARPYIVMKTVDEQIVPWTCSQSDALADDWTIVDHD